MSNTNFTSLSTLIQCNVDILSTAIELIQRLPADKYNHIQRPHFESCLGKHMRHILDHYLCFIRDLPSTVINYEKRDRNSQLETDREYAIQLIGQIQQKLSQLAQQGNGDSPLSVVLCNDIESPDGELTLSSIRRELQFLHGHTVHHFALITAMLRFSGIDTDNTIGVAPSTLLHQKTVKVSA